VGTALHADMHEQKNILTEIMGGKRSLTATVFIDE
jgi:hypothetical protein